MKKQNFRLLKIAGVTTALALISGIASAALPASVTDALSAASTDGATLGGIVLGVIVVIVALKYLRRAA